MISREVNRHGGRAGYRAATADEQAAAARSDPRSWRSTAHHGCARSSFDLLRDGWSPASITGRLPIDYAHDQACRVSHEAIYHSIYAHHDSPPTLTGIVDMIGPLPQHHGCRGEDLFPTVHLDRGDDSGTSRDLLEIVGFEADIAVKGQPVPIQAGRRWPVERLHAWMNGYGKLRRAKSSWSSTSTSPPRSPRSVD